MSLPVVFRPEARAEYDDAVDWYERQRPGLGGDFLDEVQRVLDRIAANPSIHAVVLQDVRKAVVRRFPYCIYYREQAGQLLEQPLLGVGRVAGVAAAHPHAPVAQGVQQPVGPGPQAEPGPVGLGELGRPARLDGHRRRRQGVLVGVHHHRPHLGARSLLSSKLDKGLVHSFH